MNNRNTNVAYAAGMIGMIYALFNWDWFLFAMSLSIHFLLISIFSAVTHRYFSHRSFDADDNLMWCLSALTVCYSYATPINWAYLHSAHHRYADTDRDPHVKGIPGLLSASYLLPDKKFLITSRWFTDRKNLFLHNHAAIIVLIYGVLCWLISPVFFVWGWLLPVFLLHFGQGFHKTFSHNGQSATNHWWMEFLIPMGGEWVHRYHHERPADPKFKNRWYEFDPGWLLIQLLRKKSIDARPIA